MSVTEDLRRIYDRYFASADYDARYPHPNQGTLRCLWAHGIGKAEHVLDIGSGNGRYAVPVLLHSRTELTACDISPVALKGLRLRLSDQPDCLRRLHTLEGDALSLPPGARFDFMLMLFGVLGHIATQTERLATLRQLRALARPGCVLVLSVPSVWRRRPIEAMQSWWRHRRGSEDWHDIHFERRIDQTPARFFYHLYGLNELRRDLTASGWHIESLEAESILPEWLITPRPWLNRLDAACSRACPSALGYGIRVVARPLVKTI
ncbi:MAG: hypothetical protein RL657_1415 [Pseudomonadota bacterium]|jgi:SAM-dependent methyltransferase